MGVLERRVRDDAVARLAADVTGFALGASAADITSDARGSSDVAFARQVAAYLCHTAFELSLSRVAAAFGRDRSTIAYACHAIEDRRDEPQFDLWISTLEAMLREASPLQPAPARAEAS